MVLLFKWSNEGPESACLGADEILHKGGETSLKLNIEAYTVHYSS